MSLSSMSTAELKKLAGLVEKPAKKDATPIQLEIKTAADTEVFENLTEQVKKISEKGDAKIAQAITDAIKEHTRTQERLISVMESLLKKTQPEPKVLVNVPHQPEPKVTVNIPHDKRATKWTITPVRDYNNLIESITIEEK